MRLSENAQAELDALPWDEACAADLVDAASDIMMEDGLRFESAVDAADRYVLRRIA